MNLNLTVDGTARDAQPPEIAELLKAGTPFWLDIDVGDPPDEAALGILTDTFGFHHLAIEDAERFGQRPKVDDYEGFALVVAYGTSADAALAEVHLFVGSHYLVSVHRAQGPTIDRVRRRLTHHRGVHKAPDSILQTYLILDELTDSFFPVLSAFDDRVDDLEASILKTPTEAQLGELFDMKRRLMAIRKTITPQRDMMAGLASGIIDLPGATAESERYFRDLYDHLIRISDMVDGYRDLLSGVMDTHLSMVSNRLNVVMKQLAVIATVFLPLSFLTGFFGQNFAWMVNRLTSGWIFAVVGLGTEVIAVIVLVVLFRRRGWLGGPTA